MPQPVEGKEKEDDSTFEKISSKHVFKNVLDINKEELAEFEKVHRAEV
jgi:hypothetical protein